MKKIIIINILLLAVVTSYTQVNKLSVSGYVSNMHTYMSVAQDAPLLKESLYHNRLNFQYYANDNITFDLELRNRFLNTDLYALDNQYAANFEIDNGFLDLTWNLMESSPLLLNSTIDRFYMEYNKDNWNVTIGRQRINWGQCFAWNPNDIFNSFSFFDFDYVERPGADAVRIQYYDGMASHAELAVKMDNDTNLTAAGFYQFNKFGYDFQVLGGIVNGEDYVGGIGLTGNIKNLSIRGEASYYIPVDEGKETLVAALGLDYTFENSLSLNIEGLYNQNVETEAGFNIVGYEASPKRLGFSEFTLMGNVSYPISPLVTGTIAGMYIPGANGYYIGPSFDISLADNISLSLVAQYFYLEAVEVETKIKLGFIRMKYSF